MLAYLDPGSGSLIAQMVVGAFAGAAVAFKLGWRRILAPFSRRGRSEPKETVTTDDEH